MSGLNQVFVGLMLVGAWLTFKVSWEGLRRIEVFQEEVRKTRTSIRDAVRKEAELQEQIQVEEESVEELKKMVKELEGVRGTIDRDILQRKRKAEDKSRTRFKVDM